MEDFNEEFSFVRDGEKSLLHGMLVIKIIKARGLKNKDGLRGFHGSLTGSFKICDVSDPFVEVMAGKHRLVKTKVINNDLNPEWNESFFVPVAHYVSELEFLVQDSDFNQLNVEVLGKHFLDVDELVQFNDGKAQRIGLQKSVTLDDKASHGELDYYIEYIPHQMLHETFEVDGVYFKERQENSVKLYVNADDIDDGSFDLVTYGGPDDNEKVWTPPRLWRDIYDAICDAKHFIYITGWSVDTTISLLRDEDKEEAEAQGKPSPYIGELLKTKADEGLTVNVMVWDDMSSSGVVPFILPGMMGTHDQETLAYFRNTNVNCKLAPMIGDNKNNVAQSLGKTAMFTHHQKLVILDAPCEDDPDSRELLAFVGGVDLTNGRWDNRMHQLFRTLNNVHEKDCYNKCFNVDADKVGPRQPWQDIHTSMRGPGVLDVLTNFTERWGKQAADKIDQLVDMDLLGLRNFAERNSQDQWHTQLLRSIDARTANFNKTILDAQNEVDIENIEGVMFEKISEEERGKKKKGMFSKLKDKAKKKIKSEFLRFEASNASLFRIPRSLLRKKGRETDASIHTGLVHHIRRAQHCIYIESQYFLGNSHMWDKYSDVKCGNLIATEILLKICEKIERRERFAAYIVIPMWPEGIPESAAVQAILYWQYLTIQSMYKRIAKVIAVNRVDATPKDYLNFYCLGNREVPEGSCGEPPNPGKPMEELLNRTRRHQIYVHSKMFIVDDTMSLIGSANVNQRSLDGSRDSEIVLAAYQPAHVATAAGVPHGDVHGFRLHCWASLTNSVDDVMKDPSSLDCVQYVNAIAEKNWNDYTNEECVEMNSHLLPYPYSIEWDGTVNARLGLENGCFPDTEALVLGKYSEVLPNILTT